MNLEPLDPTAWSNLWPIPVCYWHRSVKVVYDRLIMLIKWIYMSLLIFVIQDVTADTGYIGEKNKTILAININITLLYYN